MSLYRLCLILYAVVITFSLMYAPQPILPILAKEFNASIVEVSYFNSLMFIPLAIAPLFYGYLLEYVKAKTILVTSLLFTAITQYLLSISTSYEMFLTIRFIESWFFPAVLTAAMTIISRLGHDNIQKYMSIYIATTVFGGMIGRVLSGYLSTLFSWQSMFATLAASALLSALLFLPLKSNFKPTSTKAKLSDLHTILKDSRYLTLYFATFLIYFVFSGFLNILPFRAQELSEGISATKIGFLYFGYIIGIAISLSIKKSINKLRGELNAMLVFLAIYFLSIFGFYIENLSFVFINIFLFCLGMFGVHSIASGYVNSFSKENKGIVNGLYISFYYFGGIFGTQIPSILYEKYSWEGAIFSFNIALALAMVLLLRVRLNFKK